VRHLKRLPRQICSFYWRPVVILPMPSPRHENVLSGPSLATAKRHEIGSDLIDASLSETSGGPHAWGRPHPLERWRVDPGANTPGPAVRPMPAWSRRHPSACRGPAIGHR
jgi:hypothetical protein